MASSQSLRTSQARPAPGKLGGLWKRVLRGTKMASQDTSLTTRKVAEMNCDASLLLWGLFAFPMGLVALALGIASWRKGGASLVNRWVDPSEHRRVRYLGPIIGTAFTFAGAAIVSGQLRCGSYLQFPHLLNLSWTWWPGIWAAIILGTATGIWNARQMPPAFAMLMIVLSSLFGVAAGQAAGFHTGIYASRWFGVVILCGILATVVNMLALRSKRKCDTDAAGGAQLSSDRDRESNADASKTPTTKTGERQ